MHEGKGGWVGGGGGGGGEEPWVRGRMSCMGQLSNSLNGQKGALCFACEISPKNNRVSV